MFNRLLFVAGAALAFAGPIRAQAPATTTPVLPPTPAPAPVATAPATVWEPTIDAGYGQWWVSGDYIAAWFSGDNVPPLVTTGAPGTGVIAAGVLGQPSTAILFGNNTANDDIRSGIRVSAGYWFDPAHTWSIEASATVLESQATVFSASSDGSTILARPFFNILTQRPDAVLVAFPGTSSGNVDARDASGNFYEFHLDFTEKVVDKGWFRLDSILGYRFYRYDEGLRIRQTVNPLGAAFAAGTQLTAEDDFNTRNEFNGADLGLRAQFGVGEQLSVGLYAKCAVGDLTSDVTINGNTLTTAPGAVPVTQAGGIYALSSNIGSHGNREWVIMPDFGINASWQAAANVRVTLGYSVFLLDHIARAADQVDFNINTNLLPGGTGIGPGIPAFNFVKSDVWVQSLNLGVEWRY